MMKKIIGILAVILVLATAFSCKKEATDNQDKSSGNHDMAMSSMDSGNHDMDMGNTKVVKAGDYQVAFDLMDKKMHDDMMKDMKHDMKDMGTTHYILVTVSDVHKKVIKDAKVFINVKTPDGTIDKKMGMVMEGGGMFHYGSGFNMQTAGTYHVTANLIVNGNKLEAKTMFDK